ncbi:hypothetical protein [Stenotrophomonas sp. Iso1]|uniref:hypothetical protein n=1 Tax=Stenotrophomonas sp. Iso1 TaxID=2977283 RepID=UPI0022B77379|nr:hypothetical protein [Stenotrophomonas sp. Iso1]
MNKIKTPLIALMLCLPLAAQATSQPESVSAEIKREMASSRAELRTEMDTARAELETENLSLGNSFNIGKRSHAKSSDSNLPDAHITPAGELVIDGKTVATTAQQRRLLLDYRGKVLSMAKAGIDVGEKAAMAALQATDVSLFSLIVGGLTGGLERRVETLVKEHVEPMVTQICQRLPEVLVSQQALATSVPQFQPYANLDQEDIDRCDSELRHDIAQH